MIHIGKRTKIWNASRRLWVSNNPPNHEGYYICGICTLPVHYSEMVLDHINGRGGELLSSVENLQPTHVLCNNKKGSKRGFDNVSRQEYEIRRLMDL